jgi:hypothetical protein
MVTLGDWARGLTGAVLFAGVLTGAGLGWKYQFESWEKPKTPKAKTRTKEMPKINPRRPGKNQTYLARAIQERSQLQMPKPNVETTTHSRSKSSQSTKYDAHWILERDTYTSRSTTGTLYHDKNKNGVVDSQDKVLAQTLELPYLENQRNVSSIPFGDYSVRPRTSQKFKDHFIVDNVPGRGGILFHVGNYPRNTQGCVLVGSTKGKDFVGNSRNTMNKLNKGYGRNKRIHLRVQQKRPTKNSNLI